VQFDKTAEAKTTLRCEVMIQSTKSWMMIATNPVPDGEELRGGKERVERRKIDNSGASATSGAIAREERKPNPSLWLCIPCYE
jgi:hypothetical protein